MSARASSPASESSPRPGSSVTPRRSGRSSLSSHLEPSETESIRNFGEEEKQDEQLSITSANDDDDVVVETDNKTLESRPISAASSKSEKELKNLSRSSSVNSLVKEEQEAPIQSIPQSGKSNRSEKKSLECPQKK